jgi:antibiotic biosynthesis monooxygenase (ABM) superfamily enzyme
MNAPPEDPPVTGILEVFVEPGQEAAFEARLRILADASLRQPGHLGISTLRPGAPGEPYRVIYKYDRRSNYDRWHASDERKELFATVDQYAARTVARQESGLESWLEFESAAGPPKWKSTIVSWFGIYPVALGWTYVMMWLGLSHLEPPVRIFILSVLVLPVTAYVVGPRIAHLMRGWLYA